MGLAVIDPWPECHRHLMLHQDRDRAGSFGEDAEQYDRARPGYPASLIDDLLAGNPHMVLDVGCGTGIASRLLVDRGCQLIGVEPDPRMVTVGRAHGLVVEEATFEQWEPGSRRFDLLVSAQAWHWVDPPVGSAKAAAVLRPNARIGLFWNVGHPLRELKKRLDEVYARLAPGLGRSSALLRNADDRFEATADALRSTRAFSDVAVKVFTQDREYTTKQWLDQLPTHSDHRSLPPDQRHLLLEAVGDVIDEEGGRFVMKYESVLVSGMRTS
jgi:SAM-dependent methyltransferase